MRINIVSVSVCVASQVTDLSNTGKGITEVSAKRAFTGSKGMPSFVRSARNKGRHIDTWDSEHYKMCVPGTPPTFCKKDGDCKGTGACNFRVCDHDKCKKHKIGVCGGVRFGGQGCGKGGQFCEKGGAYGKGSCCSMSGLKCVSMPNEFSLLSPASGMPVSSPDICVAERKAQRNARIAIGVPTAVAVLSAIIITGGVAGDLLLGVALADVYWWAILSAAASVVSSAGGVTALALGGMFNGKSSQELSDAKFLLCSNGEQAIRDMLDDFFKDYHSGELTECQNGTISDSYIAKVVSSDNWKVFYDNDQAAGKLALREMLKGYDAACKKSLEGVPASVDEFCKGIPAPKAADAPYFCDA